MHKLNCGFTLIEIMIALFIFTIMATITATGLHTVLTARKHINTNAKRLEKLELALTLLQRDVEQAINRPIVDSKGREQPAFLGTPTAMTFTRAGFVNPLSAVKRSTLQRVAYFVKDDQLIRETWFALDQPPDAKPQQRVLLTGVIALNIRYLDRNKKFHSSWPFTQQQQQTPSSTTLAKAKTQALPLPRAIEIRFTLKDWGKMTRVIAIPATGINIKTIETQTPQQQPTKKQTKQTTTT